MDNVLWARKCIFCDKVGENFICKDCEDKIETYLKNNLETHVENVQQCISLYVYAMDIRKAMLRYKFHSETYMAEIFAEKLIERLEKENIKFDIIVFPAISFLTKRKRGFNQSQLLAKAVAKSFDVPCENIFKKRMFAIKQAGLSKTARQINAIYNFSIKDCDVKGKNILIVDDIITTGATMYALAKLLKKKKAGKIYGISVAQAAKK